MFTGYTAPQNNSQYLNMIMSLLSKVGDTVGGAIKSGQQNQVANRFMQAGNTANAPRAALVNAGPNASQMAPGTPTQGTQPMYPTNAQGQLGGTNELQMAMALQKQQAAQQQQNMNMQLHQSQMGINNTKANYLQQYGTESPGNVRQGSQSQAQTSVWGTANGQPSAADLNNAAKVNGANQKALSVFGAPMTAVLDSNNGKWVPSMTNDPQNPQAPGPGAKPLYYVNPRWSAVTGGQHPGVIDGTDYNNAMTDINSGMAIHKTMRQHYQGAWDSLLDSGGKSPAPQNTPPTVAGQGPGKNTPNAPSAFINSVIPQASPAQPNAPAQPGATPPAGNTGAVIPTVQGNQPPVAPAVSTKQTGYMSPGMSIGPTGSPFAGRPGRYLSDGTFMPY